MKNCQIDSSMFVTTITVPPACFFERRENAHITVFFPVKFLLSVKPVLGGQPRDLGWCPLNRCVIQVSLYFDYTLVPCCLL